MAAPRLLSKTDLAGHEPVPLAGRTVLESHARLAALLAARGLPAGLFAEPVLSRRPDGAPSSVAWYGEGDGEPAPLSSLSPARRAEAEAMLRASLAALAPALDDPDGGQLLRRALLVADPDSVLAVDGRVVITGWGLAPRGTGEDPVRLAALLREGLGRYHPALADAGPEVFAGTAPILAAAAAAAAPPPLPQAPPPAPEPPRAPPPPAAPVAAAAPVGGWWMLPAGLGIAVVFLLLGFWLGWRAAVGEWAGRELFASVDETGPTQAAIARSREANAALAREIEQARAALAGEICRPAGPLPGLAPTPTQTPGPAPTLTPTAPPPERAAPGRLPAAPRDDEPEPPPAPDPPPLPAPR